MSPNSNEAPLQLPPPVMEQEVVLTKPAEKVLVGSEKAPQTEKAPTPIAPVISLPPAPTMPAVSMQSDVSVTTQSSTQLTNDDGDLIEKEWVNKAKLIVERNRDDPYKQSEELTVFKADYMKNRYGKTIKLNK